MKDLVHVKAPGNWINDPNGFIYYKGKYHLFFQHFPYAPEWGTMHWGHTVSEDLVHWEYQGIALFPTKEYDQNGVFSGTALEEDGKLKIYYSAVKYLKPNPEDIHRVLDDAIQTSQAMIVSEDGFHFNNWDKKKVLPTVHDEEVGEPKMRDPKVWKDGDSYYMMMPEEFSFIRVKTEKTGLTQISAGQNHTDGRSSVRICFLRMISGFSSAVRCV